jgi:hypothetical protein
VYSLALGLSAPSPTTGYSKDQVSPVVCVKRLANERMILVNFIQENTPKWLLDGQQPYLVGAMCTASLDMVKLLIEAEYSISRTLIEVEYTASETRIEAERSSFHGTTVKNR